jgi:hypothetical protein
MLSGSLPAELGNLSNLQYLYLYNNELSGFVPPELASLSNLRDLRLSNNTLTVHVPSILFAMPSLDIMLLDWNLLSGPLPFDSILSPLRYLVASHNQLNGILNGFQHVGTLEWLDLSDNRFSGALPSSLPSELFVLELSQNRLTGVVPAWRSVSVRRVGLGFNELYARAPLSIDLPTVSLVDLSDNPVQARALQAGSVQLQEPGFLNTTRSTLPCPYPVVSKDLIWVRSPCALNLDLLWGLLLASGAMAALALLWYHCCHAMKAEGSQTNKPLRVLQALGLWVVVVADLVTDGLFNANMLEYVASVPLSSVQCLSMNGLFQPAFLPDLAIADYRDQNFTDYLPLLEEALAVLVVRSELDAVAADETVDFVIDAFSAQCTLMDGCIYVADTNVCAKDESFEAFPIFSSLVYVVAGVMASKELVKVVVVVWCTWVGHVPSHLRELCATSVLLPVLALRPHLFRLVMSYETSAVDARWALVSEGLFENFPQLALAVYYAFSVTGTGLSDVEMVSLFLSVLACARLGFLSVGDLWQRWCTKAEPVATAPQSALEMLPSSAVQSEA